jgi:uncharacterized membrane protein YcaP (DUF421 family)
MAQLWETINFILGLNTSLEDIAAWQMATRTIVIYVVTVLIARVAGQRFFGQHTAFDVVLGIILGSVLSRAINGTAPFFETIIAGVILIVLHVLFATLTFYSHSFGLIFKGQPYQLVKDGEIVWNSMRHSRISEKDLMAAVRLNHLTSIDQVKEAYLERSGQISVIPRPYVVEVGVQPGVQTIRVDIP